MDESLPEVRIGDAERKVVDARLQAALTDGMLTVAEYDERSALCWSARTRADLEPLTRDLPVPAAEAPVPAKSEDDDEDDEKPSLASRVGSGLVTLALIGGAAYLGGQAVTAHDGFTIFGERNMAVSAEQNRIELGAVFGKFDIVVPNDVRVRTTGMSIFWSIDCAEACQGTGPEVVIDMRGIFGSVDILTQSERDRGVDFDDDDE